jgi:hypothetical protein
MKMSDYLSIASVVILVGYILYNESTDHVTNQQTFSDNGVMQQVSVDNNQHPFPAVSIDLPMNVTFANEKVPVDITDVRERLDKELQINTYFHSNTIFLIKRANRWLPQIEKILREHNIPDDFKYLPLIESNLLNVRSPKDAVGYWQILESSGKEYGLEITREVDERYDPIKATEAACKYLAQAYRKFGNWTMVAASYNRGMAGMQRAIDDQKVDSYYDLYLNEETSRYVFRILAIKEIAENPMKYGFRIKPEHLYEEEPLRYVEVDESIRDLVDFALDQGTNYKMLKHYNPWLREEKLTIRKGQTYRIAFPA